MNERLTGRYDHGAKALATADKIETAAAASVTILCCSLLKRICQLHAKILGMQDQLTAS